MLKNGLEPFARESDSYLVIFLKSVENKPTSETMLISSNRASKLFSRFEDDLIRNRSPRRNGLTYHSICRAILLVFKIDGNEM